MQKYIMVGALVLGVGGATFFGGLQYGKSVNASARRQPGAFGQNFSGSMNRLRGAGGNFTAGEVIAKDDKSLTVKLRDGGSKIIFYTAATPVSKEVSGALEDVAVGQQVTISGTANPDGSLNAQSIQLRNLPPAANGDTNINK